jgi:hypothetical protein
MKTVSYITKASSYVIENDLVPSIVVLIVPILLDPSIVIRITECHYRRQTLSIFPSDSSAFDGP